MEITADQFRRQFKTLAARFVDHRDLEALLRSCSLSLVPAGTQIISYGGPCSTLYLVWSGRLTASIEQGDIKLALGDIGPGEWVGEVTLIEPGPATASVTAAVDSHLLALSHDAFKALRATNPAAVGALLHALSLNIAERLRATSERAIERVGNGEYRLHDLSPKEKEAVVGHIRRLLSMLLGTHGAA